MGNFLVTI